MFDNEIPDDGRGESQAFLIDRDGTFETKVKDKLEIVYQPRQSANHFSKAWSETAAVYAVKNLTKVEKGLPTTLYTVAFFRSESGEHIIAVCDCKARKRCKHICAAWLKHADAERTGFVSEL